MACMHVGPFNGLTAFIPYTGGQAGKIGMHVSLVIRIFAFKIIVPLGVR